MADKKNIWHEPIELPTNGKELVIETKRCGYESYELSYNEDTGEYAPWSWVQKDVIKWCYLDDLLELSNKVESLESEVSRYKKALEKIKEVLIENTPNGDTLLEETIYFITQALEKASQ